MFNNPRLINFAKKISLTHIYIITIIILSSFIFLYNLDANSLENWDEGIYALISHETAENPSLTLHLNGSPWYEKPPLGFFATALSIKILGLSEFAIRFPSSIYLIIATIFVFLLSKKILNNPHLGFLTTLFFLISPALLNRHIARSGDLDSALLLFTVAAFYFLLKAEIKPKFIYLFSLFAGLAVMWRGSSGFFILIIAAIYLILTKKWRLFDLKTYIYSSLIFLAVILPWHIQQLVVNGQGFWRVYFLEQFFSRISEPIQNHFGSWNYYLDYLQKRNGLGHFLILFAYFYCLYKAIIKKNKELILPLIWLTVTFLLITIMKSKLYWYSITLIPPMFIMLTYFIHDLIQSSHHKYFRLFHAVLLIFLIIQINIFFIFQDYKFIFQEKTSTAEKISAEISKFDITTPIIIYKTFYWYNNWAMPDIEYYLKIRQNKKILYTYDDMTPDLTFNIAQNEKTFYYLIDNEFLKNLDTIDPTLYKFENLFTIDNITFVKRTNLMLK